MAGFAKALTELREARGRAALQVRRIDEAIALIGKLASRNGLGFGVRKARRKPMSAAARREIAAAQRARWAKWKAKQVKKAA
jgi:hypothetical protein